MSILFNVSMFNSNDNVMISYMKISSASHNNIVNYSYI